MQPWYEETHSSGLVNEPGDVGQGPKTCVYTFQKQQVTSQPWVPRQVLAAACCVSFPHISFLLNYLLATVTNSIYWTFPARLFGLHKVQTINDDLNASLANADELSKEFSSLLNEVSSQNKPNTQVQYWCSPLHSLNYVQKCTYILHIQSDPAKIKYVQCSYCLTFDQLLIIADIFPLQTSSPVSREKTPSTSPRVTSPSRAGSNGSSSSQSFSPTLTTYSDSITPWPKKVQSSPDVSSSPLSSPKIQRSTHSPPLRGGSESHLYGQHSPKHSPHSPRRNSPSRMNLSPRDLSSPSLSPTNLSFGQSSRSPTFHPSPNLLNPYDKAQMGRRSPRPDRGPCPMSMNPISSTLPRNFGFREPGRCCTVLSESIKTQDYLPK